MKMIQSIHEQLKPDILIRELNKAYIGFSRCQDKINCSLNISGMSLHTDSEPIATGNWGNLFRFIL